MSAACRVAALSPVFARMRAVQPALDWRMAEVEQLARLPRCAETLRVPLYAMV